MENAYDFHYLHYIVDFSIVFSEPTTIGILKVSASLESVQPQRNSVY